MANSPVAHGLQITVTSLESLRAAEADILARLAGESVFSQLFLLDPIRALAEVAVVVLPQAAREWEDVSPALRQRDRVGPGSQYDRIKAVGGLVGVKVTIRGLIVPAGINAAAADEEVTNELTDRGELVRDIGKPQ